MEAIGPSAARECVGWRLRATPGRRQNASPMAPTTLGVDVGSNAFTEPSLPGYQYVWVGITRVDSAHPVRSASITAVGPPRTYPQAERELCTITMLFVGLPKPVSTACIETMDSGYRANISRRPLRRHDRIICCPALNRCTFTVPKS